MTLAAQRFLDSANRLDNAAERASCEEVHQAFKHLAIIFLDCSDITEQGELQRATQKVYAK